MKKLLLIFMFVSVVSGQVNHTGWPLELLSWNVNKAYPGIEYNYRLGVKGGEYPYTFALRHGPEGMIVDSTGALIWTPDSATTDSVRVVVKDMLNDSLVVQYNITATTTGFYFVDSATGNNANAGTQASPWASVVYAISTADSSSYIYIKSGTYVGSLAITSTMCHRLISYPGNMNVKIVANGTNTGFSLQSVKNAIFHGLIFDSDNRKWFFNVNGSSENIIWRKNEIKNQFDTTSENPAGIFFADQTTRYPKMIIQDNVFHAVRDPNVHHGASVTTYGLINSIFEDNTVYDIDGRGFNEKVNGRRNTIRGNIMYDIYNYPAIILNSNPSSDSTEICYNFIYNCINGDPRNVGIQIGANGNYVANIFVHHNTVIGNIRLQSATINSDTCTNINVYKNIIGMGGKFPYVVSPVGNDLYPNGFRSKVLIDSNIVFGKANLTAIAGYDWGITNCNWEQWLDSGKDIHSYPMQLTYDADSIPNLSDSLLNIYGHLANSFAESETPIDTTETPIDTTETPVDTNNSSLRYRVITNDSLISESDTTFVYQIDLSDSISSIDAAIDSSKQISVTNSSGVNLKRVAHYASGASCSVYWLGRKRASQSDTFYIKFGAVTEDSVQTFTSDSITDYYSFENIITDSVKNDASGLYRLKSNVTSATDTIFGTAGNFPAYSALSIPSAIFSDKTNFTINLTAAFDNFLSSRYLFSLSSGTNILRVYYSTNSKYYINIGTNAWYGSVIGQTTNVNTPYMYTIVYNGNGVTNYDKLKFYINSDTATIDYSGTVDATMPDFLSAIFTFSNASYPITGILDEAMISSDSKSSGWVVDRYNMINNDQFYSVSTVSDPPRMASGTDTLKLNAKHFGTTQWLQNGSVIASGSSISLNADSAFYAGTKIEAVTGSNKSTWQFKASGNKRSINFK